MVIRRVGVNYREREANFLHGKKGYVCILEVRNCMCGVWGDYMSLTAFMKDGTTLYLLFLRMNVFGVSDLNDERERSESGVDD